MPDETPRPAPRLALSPHGVTTRPVVLARDLAKDYGTGRNRTPILRGVSLEIAPGEVVLLVGPSGSGKTTLLSLLGCILTPDAGRLEVLGKEVGAMGQDDRTTFRRTRLGFVFQSFNLMPSLSAEDNLILAYALRGVAGGAARQGVADLLDRVGLTHRARLRPARLSAGECQRVAIARALVGGPNLLLADEPTAALDAENGQMALRLLSGLARERGAALVVVTHDERIFHFADRILRLTDGYLDAGTSAAADHVAGPMTTQPRGPRGREHRTC